MHTLPETSRPRQISTVGFLLLGLLVGMLFGFVLGVAAVLSEPSAAVSAPMPAISANPASFA